LYQTLLRRFQEFPPARFQAFSPEEKIKHQKLLADTHFRLGHLYLTDPRPREANRTLALLQFRDFLAMNDGRPPQDRHPQYEMVKDFVDRYDVRGGR